MRDCFTWMFAAGISTLVSGAACAQDFPSKPVRILASGPGGSSDAAARLIAPGLSASLGQQVIVDNRPSGITAETAAKAPADGYNMLISGSTLWLATLMQELRYDPVRDFVPVTLLVKAPNLLVVHPSLPVKSVKDLIALAKAHPGALNYSSATTGSASHLAAELFKHMAGVDIVRINFKSGSSRMVALVGGEVQLEFATPGGVAPHVKSGRLRAVAISSLEPSPLAPGVPTVAATGLPGYESVGLWGMFAPARTPSAVINKLAQDTVRVLGQADVRQKFLSMGSETIGGSPEVLATTVKADLARMGKVVKDAGIRSEE